jgi:hypothetical protein
MLLEFPPHAHHASRQQLQNPHRIVSALDADLSQRDETRFLGQRARRTAGSVEHISAPSHAQIR